ncbi:MAG TPA: ABC transporter permease [Thermoanaerobaculia bacterium]|nr:ABC transporter permease [Thermoanaerobaculia bacterium]
MKQALAIVVHELKLFLSDRRSVVVGIVTPILLATFFGFLFSGAGRQDAAKIPVLVADADDSAVSRAVVAGLAADALLSVSPAAAEDARQAVRRGKAAAGVVLPKGFGEGAVQAFFGAAAASEIVLLVDPSRATEAGLVRGLLAEKVFREASREAFGGATGTKVLEESLGVLEADPSPPTPERQALKDLLRDVTRWQGAAKGGTAGGGAAGGLGTAVPFTLKEEPVTARQGVTYNSYAHSFAGMAIQFLLFVAIDFGIALLLERQGGLWKRLRSAPLSRSALLLGKTAAGALVGLVSVAATFAFGIVVLGIRIEGSVPGFVLLLLASALMASSFGLLLAALGRTPGATRGLAILAVLLLVMLGGGWVPAFVFPAWLQKVTLVLPTRWAIDGLDAVTWRGAGLAAGALPAVAVLLGYTVLFLLVARLRFRWTDR